MSKQKFANGFGSLVQKSMSLMSCGEGPEHRIIFMELLASVIKKKIEMFNWNFFWGGGGLFFWL